MVTKATVLVADDDAGFRETLCDALQDRGYESLAVETGKDALDAIRNRHPAVAIIDLKLPDMAGLDIIRAAEEKDRDTDTDFILLTGYASQESAIEAVNLGVFSYMQKPCDIDQLMLIVHRALERKEMERKNREQSTFIMRMLDSMTHPFFVIDATTHEIIMGNRAAGVSVGGERVTCYSLTHGRNMPCAEGHECPLETVRRTKKAVMVEHEHVGPDGTTRIYEVHGYPVLDGKGDVVQMIEYTIDISDRKHAQGELLKRVTEIENLDSFMVDREMRIIEVKREVNGLLKELGRPPRYTER